MDNLKKCLLHAVFCVFRAVLSVCFRRDHFVIVLKMVCLYLS